MTIDLNKVEFSSIPFQEAKGDDLLTAIVKVSLPNYIPKCVSLRAQIDPTFITCDVLRKDLPLLDQDKHVLSVSIKTLTSLN